MKARLLHTIEQLERDKASLIFNEVMDILLMLDRDMLCGYHLFTNMVLNSLFVDEENFVDSFELDYICCFGYTKDSHCMLSLKGVYILIEVVCLSQNSSTEMIVDKNKDISRLHAQVYCFTNSSNPQINCMNTSFISFSCFLVVQMAANFDVTIVIGRTSNKMNGVGRIFVF